MKNEERIIELLVETLQKVDRHQAILEEHIQQWKEQNERWKEQQATNLQIFEVLRIQTEELRNVSAGLSQNDRIDHEQSQRIELLHQTSLEEQRVIREMLSLLMAQNKALKDNNLL